MKKQGRTNNYFIWVIVGWVVMTLVFGGGLFKIPGMDNFMNNTSNTSTITDVPTKYDNQKNIPSEPTFTFKQFLNYLLLFIILVLIYLYIYFRIKKKKGEKNEKQRKQINRSNGK